MRIYLSIKALLILILLLPTVGRAAVEINILGVTPMLPLYETVGDTARLNCEMTFENNRFPLELVSWKVRAFYTGHAPVDFPGTPEDFWYNVRIRSLNNGFKDITPYWAGFFENGVYNQGAWKIPKRTRVLFYLPYTDYPLSDLPLSLTVYVKVRDTILHEERELIFPIRPRLHSTDLLYIFPVGFDRFEPMAQSLDWFMGDHQPLLGDMHGSGHELYAAHRRVHKWWDGLDQPVLFNQRYAHDIAIRDANGNTHAPFPASGFKTVQSYYAWGKKVFAMAGGTVVHVVRDMGDNLIAGVITPDGGAGNRVIIQHPNGESSIYAHLQFGSIPVEIQEGAMVSQGQLLGKVGNSGNSSEPHLHFTLQNRPVYEEHDCFPIRFVNISIRRDGEPDFQPWTTSLPSGVTIRIN